MKNEPIISVLMPVFNEERFIAEAMESILNQTFEDFEFIIIDDGSTDNCVNIIHSFNDNRIKLIHNKKNVGIAKSLNKGIKNSKGKYIARMDANDVSINNRLEKQFEIIEKMDICLVSSHHYYINYQSEITAEEVFEFNPTQTKSHLLFKICFKHPSIMFKKSVLDIMKKNYDSIYRLEDFEFYTRLSIHGDFFIIPEKLIKIRPTDFGLSSKHRDDFLKDWRIIRLNYINNLGVSLDETQEDILIRLLDKEFDKLNNYPLKKILLLTRQLISQNNSINFFPNPFFNQQVYIRINRMIKHHFQNIGVMNLIYFKQIATMLRQPYSIKNLLKLYL